jgi:hypothetical protein
MEDSQKIIENINYIHDNYLSDIAESTIFNTKEKIFIEQCKVTFNSKIDNDILQKNIKLLLHNYEKVNGLNPIESLSFQDILKTINLTAIILTCYNLSFYDFVEVVEPTSDHVELKVDEKVNKNVEKFIKHYVSIYEFIEFCKNTHGFDNQRICLELKNMYNGLKCSSMFNHFLDKSRDIIGSLFNSKNGGGNKWKNKYLKYKKKYLNIKKNQRIKQYNKTNF